MGELQPQSWKIQTGNFIKIQAILVIFYLYLLIKRLFIKVSIIPICVDI